MFKPQNHFAVCFIHISGDDRKSFNRNPKGFLIIPNNIEILESNYIDKKESKIYSYEPNEFVVECE